jgi:hypothetical protein
MILISLTQLAIASLSQWTKVSIQSKSSISYRLGANVENLQLLSGTQRGTGNHSNNKITGNSLNNSLHGLDGHDNPGDKNDSTYN